VRRVVTLGAGVVASVVLALTALGALPAVAQITGPPEISNVSASEVSSQRATFSATIEPRGSKTTYEVWIRYSPCQGGAGECPQPPLQKRIGHGKVSQHMSSRSVRAKLIMGTPGCTYEYWFVASNASGTVESERQSVTSTGGSPRPRECRG
jgi:hypothetical protein